MKNALSQLPIRLKLNPGQPGTKKLQMTYGRELVCVRYRYDLQGRKRYKTVELVVGCVDWVPGRRRKPTDLAWIRVAVDEVELQRRVRAAGGLWNRQRQLWQLRYDKVKELRLRSRLVK